MEFDNKDAEGLAECLDITPARARKYMVMRDEYSVRSHLTVKLNPNINPDARIIDVMGWGPGGIGGMVLAGKPRKL